jgi:hypothetical protein
MANNYTEFSVAVAFTSKRGVTHAKAKLAAMYAQQEVYRKDPDADDNDAGCTFYAEWEGKTLILWHDEFGRTDHAAEFIQLMMKEGYVLEPVIVQWSETSDRASPDSFGGGAVLVTKDKLYWFVPHDLAIRKWRDIEKRRERLR